MSTWNRDENWEVRICYFERAKLYAVIDPTKRVANLVSLRQVVDSLRNASPADIRNLIGPDNRIDLGEMEGRIARRLAEELNATGIQTERIDTSVISYLPVNRTHGAALLIEDDEKAKVVAEEMIAAGFPVVRIEA